VALPFLSSAPRFSAAAWTHGGGGRRPFVVGSRHLDHRRGPSAAFATRRLTRAEGADAGRRRERRDREFGVSATDTASPRLRRSRAGWRTSRVQGHLGFLANVLDDGVQHDLAPVIRTCAAPSPRRRRILGEDVRVDVELTAFAVEASKARSSASSTAFERNSSNVPFESVPPDPRSRRAPSPEPVDPEPDEAARMTSRRCGSPARPGRSMAHP